MPEVSVLPPCATTSLARQEALVATASRVPSWLLIEQPGAWGPDAMLESGLDLTVARALVARCRRAGVRPILIRRPPRARLGGADGPGRRHCYLAHSGARQSWMESLDVDDPAELVDLDLTPLASDTAPGLGTTVSGPMLLVCTNGRHDRCCSDLGRPLARALAAARAGEAETSDVWECSHIGGDRFAANLVCLPEGIYFGRVGADDGPRVAEDYRRGRLSLDHYRGRSSFPALVQAADIFLRGATGLTGIDDITAGGIEPVTKDEAVVSFLAATGSGSVAGAPAGWRMRVGRRRAADASALTCRSDLTARPWEYHLLDLTPF